MFAAALRFDLRLAGVHSLKDKRAVIKPVIEGARRRYLVSAAEVEHQDQWQQAALGFAAVGSSVHHVEEILDSVERFVWSFPEVEVVSSGRTWLEAVDA